MKQFSYFKAIFHSFFSADLYRDIAKRWPGMGFQYLLVLNLPIVLLFTFLFFVTVNSIDPQGFATKVTDHLFERNKITFDQGINRVLQSIAQIPEMRIENGRLYTDVQQPHIIYDPLTQAKLAIIDTTGKYMTLEGSNAVILFTATQAINRKADGKGEEVVYLSELSQNKQFKEEDFNASIAILSQFPYMTLKNGEIDVQAPQPYVIYSPKDNSELMVIDTTGQYHHPEDVTAPILLTKDTLYVKTATPDQYYDLRLADVDITMVHDGISYLTNAIKKVLSWLALLLFLPLAFVGLYICLIVIAFIYALIGDIITRIFDMENLHFETLFRIACVAITPSVLLFLFLPRILPSQGLIYFLISTGYIYYALKSCHTATDPDK